MVIRKITQVGSPVIRARAKKVTRPTSKETRRVIKDLTDSMRSHGLVGMAAPQIGKSVCIFVTEIKTTLIRKHEEIQPDPLRVFVNPKIVSLSKKQILGWEGCGSVACSGLFARVKRSESVVIKGFNEKGEVVILKATSFLARVIQHEFDHLDGVLFTDKADAHTFMSANEYLDMRRRDSKINR
jgi:peptide deformylase